MLPLRGTVLFSFSKRTSLPIWHTSANSCLDDVCACIMWKPLKICLARRFSLGKKRQNRLDARPLEHWHLWKIGFATWINTDSRTASLYPPLYLSIAYFATQFILSVNNRILVNPNSNRSLCVFSMTWTPFLLAINIIEYILTYMLYADSKVVCVPVGDEYQVFFGLRFYLLNVLKYLVRKSSPRFY